MTDVSASTLLEQQRLRFGISIEDCWAAYFALGGRGDLATLRGFLSGGWALAPTEIDIVSAALDDLARPDAPAIPATSVASSDPLGAATGRGAAGTSDDIIQLIAEQLTRDADDRVGPGPLCEPVRLTDVDLLIRSGRTTTVRAALPPSTDSDLLGLASPGGSVLRVDSATTSAWEMHPSGDELLVLLSGEAQIEIDRLTTATTLLQRPFEACVIPRGRWHRHRATNPDTKVIFLTPTDPKG